MRALPTDHQDRRVRAPGIGHAGHPVSDARPRREDRHAHLARVQTSPRVRRMRCRLLVPHIDDPYAFIDAAVVDPHHMTARQGEETLDSCRLQGFRRQSASVCHVILALVPIGSPPPGFPAAAAQTYDQPMPCVEITHPEDHITQLTLNRPEALNALTYELVDELHHALDRIHADHDCRVVIITGAGRGFCAGLDLRGFGVVPGTEDFGRLQQGMAVQQFIATLVPHLRSLRQPVISAVNGAAAGGGFAIALASDVRICSQSAKFGSAFVRLGISGCDIGVSWLLPRLIGAARSHELLLTGRVFDSAEADDLGLVTRVVDDNALLEEALATARLITANSPMGVWMTKEVMWSNLEVNSLQAGIDLENRTQILTSQTEDSRAAMAGFLHGQRIDWANR